jgi:amino acid permease
MLFVSEEMRKSGSAKYQRINQKTRNPVHFLRRNSAHSLEEVGLELHEGEEDSRDRLSPLNSHSTTGTILTSFYNLANTILGSGMLGLPYAYSRVGWLLGTFFLLLSACLASFSLHLLSICALTQSLPSSFHKIGSSVMSSSSLLIDLAVAIKCFGVATSYLIVIGDLMPAIFDQDSIPDIWKSRRLWISLMFVITTALSMLRNINSLRFTSFLSILFVILLTLLIGIYSLHLPVLNPCDGHEEKEDAESSGDDCQGEISMVTFETSTFTVLPIFIFSFTCHQV